MFFPRPLSALLERWLPRLAIRQLHRVYDPYHYWLVRRINRRLLSRIFPSEELSVTAGPFKGMKYLPLSSAGSALIPKLLGAYEMELHPVLEQIPRRDYDTLIDIGCAEGYYLVGLCRKLPRVTAHGFDLDEGALDTCRKLAELNGVQQRIHLHGGCNVESLRRLLGPKTLIVSDCEGVEVELLNPTEAPGLRRADILVELHDRLVPGTSSLLRERFSPTHHVNLIRTAARAGGDFPLLSGLSVKDQRLALEEFRGGPMEWAFLTARE